VKNHKGIEYVETHERFVPLAYHCLFGGKYIKTRYDAVIGRVLDRTMLRDNHPDKISRLIINIPPRHGKTLRAVQSYVARGFAINPKSNFIHTSYSDKLVHDNSVAIRDIINSEAYQFYYPHVSFKDDTNTKGLWKTSAGGTFLASPAGGSITGFGAGIVGSKTFGGALIIDDPVKPDDASSDAILRAINARWEGTFRSRLATERTPVIVIMQRISDSDFTSELLDRTGSNEKWHHLVLPAYISKDYKYEENGVYINHDLKEGALWPEKFTDEQALSLMTNIQYSQKTAPAKGEVYEREWFMRYSEMPKNIKSWSIYCDTASKTKKYNDFSVFQLWAKTTLNQGFLIDQWRDKVKVPFLKDKLMRFFDNAKKISGTSRISISIEDKDSGTGLIQALEIDGVKVKAITRREGKYARAINAADKVRTGNIFLPFGPVGDGVISEAVKFRADDSHAHDDQVDCMNDFANFELPKQSIVITHQSAGTRETIGRF
jgi:predicted phage terminase large subunit-like protein